MPSPSNAAARFAAATFLAAATMALAACGGPARTAAAPPPQAPDTTAAAAPAGPAVTEVARPNGAVEVFASPTAPAPLVTLPATTGFGSARALPVAGRADGWLQILLPTRPNGATGWIRSPGVPVRTVAFEVRVDLSERRLEVLEGGAPILQTTAAVGRDSAPTPIGRFFLVDKVETGSTSSPYGPFALGLSAHSDVLTEFGGGDGQIAVHGTNDPASIGRAVSHGCIRVPNDVAAHLADLLPLGTPVVVVG